MLKYAGIATWDRAVAYDRTVFCDVHLCRYVNAYEALKKADKDKRREREGKKKRKSKKDKGEEDVDDDDDDDDDANVDASVKFIPLQLREILDQIKQNIRDGFYSEEAIKLRMESDKAFKSVCIFFSLIRFHHHLRTFVLIVVFICVLMTERGRQSGAMASYSKTRTCMYPLSC
jgi:hypothetical protein